MKSYNKIITIVLTTLIMFGYINHMFSTPKKRELVNTLTEGAYLVDVRTPGEFASGSISGAVNIPLSEVNKKINSFKGKKSIVVFCRSGNRSRQAKRMLEKYGIEGVMNGGSVRQVASSLQTAVKDSYQY